MPVARAGVRRSGHTAGCACTDDRGAICQRQQVAMLAHFADPTNPGKCAARRTGRGEGVAQARRGQFCPATRMSTCFSSRLSRNMGAAPRDERCWGDPIRVCPPAHAAGTAYKVGTRSDSVPRAVVMTLALPWRRGPRQTGLRKLARGKTGRSWPTLACRHSPRAQRRRLCLPIGCVLCFVRDLQAPDIGRALEPATNPTEGQCCLWWVAGDLAEGDEAGLRHGAPCERRRFHLRPEP